MECIREVENKIKNLGKHVNILTLSMSMLHLIKVKKKYYKQYIMPYNYFLVLHLGLGWSLKIYLFDSV